MVRSSQLVRDLGTIVIYMHFQDHNPQHFHAIYAKHEALIRIDNGEVVRGRLPKTAGGLVEQWRQLHVGDFASNWQRAQETTALSSIGRSELVALTWSDHAGERLTIRRSVVERVHTSPREGIIPAASIEAGAASTPVRCHVIASPG